MNTNRPHDERAIYNAQAREDARAREENRPPKLIATMADIPDDEYTPPARKPRRLFVVEAVVRVKVKARTRAGAMKRARAMFEHELLGSDLRARKHAITYVRDLVPRGGTVRAEVSVEAPAPVAAIHVHLRPSADLSALPGPNDLDPLSAELAAELAAETFEVPEGSTIVGATIPAGNLTAEQIAGAVNATSPTHTARATGDGGIELSSVGRIGHDYDDFGICKVCRVDGSAPESIASCTAPGAEPPA